MFEFIGFSGLNMQHKSVTSVRWYILEWWVRHNTICSKEQESKDSKSLPGSILDHVSEINMRE